MKTYKVLVRRIVREDTVVTVKADSQKMAADFALNEAKILDPKDWDCYDCEYDAWEVVNGPA